MTTMRESLGISPVGIARPTIFLDIDDVLTVSLEFNSFQVIAAFKMGNLDAWPELWEGLILAEARENLAALHSEFRPQYVVSSSWSNYLNRKQMQELFRRTGLEFVASNLHKEWTTPTASEATRADEIEFWIAKCAHPEDAILVLDDHRSGWSLYRSQIDLEGLVVLCETEIGFVADKAREAKAILRKQTAPP